MHQVLSMMSVISTYSIASDIFFVRLCEGKTEIKFWCLRDEAHSTILSYKTAMLQHTLLIVIFYAMIHLSVRFQE